MSVRLRLLALLFAFVALLGAGAGVAGAAPPVKKEGCELIVTLPGGKTIAVPICTNGPPL
jgi:hypothetical protein